MARLWSSGFELQSVTNAVEWGATIGSPTIDTTTKRSGAASLRCNPTAATAYIRHKFVATPSAPSGGGNFFARFYLRIASSTGGMETIARFYSDLSGALVVGLNLNSNNTLELWRMDTNVQVGSDSSALAANTWYRVEFSYNNATGAVDARIDGLSFASGTQGIEGAVTRLYVGLITSATADIYIDDVAVNDDTGAVQNSWLGAGSIVHMHPTAAGDAAATTGLYSAVDEVTPNDATDYIEVDTIKEVDYNFETSANAGIGASDTITLIQIGTRQRTETAASAGWRGLIMSQSGGTTAYGTAKTNNSGIWKTNGDVLPQTYSLTSYTDPQAGGAWTPALLDTMQAGIDVTDATPNLFVSTIWALVEYVPAAGSTLDVTDIIQITESATMQVTHNISMLDSVAIAENKEAVSTKKLIELLILSEAYRRDTSKTLSDLIMLTDSMRKVSSAAFAESFTLAESKNLSVGKSLTTSVSLTDLFARTFVTTREYDESFTLSDAIMRSIEVDKFAAITLEEAFIANTGSEKILNEIVELTDILRYNYNNSEVEYSSSAVSYAGLQENASNIKKDIGLLKISQLQLLEFIAKTQGTTRTLIEMIGITELLSLHSQLSFSEVLTIIESIGMTISQVTFLSLTEQLTLAETLSKVTGKTRSEVLSILELLNKGVKRLQFESISLFESLSKDINKVLTPSELPLTAQVLEFTGMEFAVQTQLLITESLSKTAGLRKTDTVIFADSFRKEATRQNVDTLKFIDNRSLDVILRKSNTFNMLESHTTDTVLEHVLDDMITLADAIRRSIELKTSEVLVITEGRVFNKYLSILDNLSMQELLSIGNAYFVEIFDEESLIDFVNTRRAVDFQDYVVFADDMSFLQQKPFGGKITIHTDVGRTHLQNTNIIANLFSLKGKTLLVKTSKKALLPSTHGKTVLFFKERK